MRVYRLSKTRYAKDLTGTGAYRNGGRWNSKGVAVIYTSSSRALCLAEIAVHIPFGTVPEDYVLASIKVPDDAILKLPMDAIPSDWKRFPHPESTKILGDTFVREALALLLKVPSAVVPGEYNYLINPGHAQFSMVKVVDTEPFVFDERLFKKQ